MILIFFWKTDQLGFHPLSPDGRPPISYGFLAGAPFSPFFAAPISIMQL